MAKDYRAMATKEITPTMEAFAEWLTKETGYAVDARTVALAGSLRNDFQASESWKSDPRNPVLSREANAEAKANERAAKAKDAADKAIARAKEAERKANEVAKAASDKAKALTAKAAADAKAANKTNAKAA